MKTKNFKQNVLTCAFPFITQTYLAGYFKSTLSSLNRKQKQKNNENKLLFLASPGLQMENVLNNISVLQHRKNTSMCNLT